MKLAVIDACIFIEFFELDLIPQFFELPIKPFTSIDVVNELSVAQKAGLTPFMEKNSLSVQKITGSEMIFIYTNYLDSCLSESNKTVLFLATKFSASVLSTCKQMRQYPNVETIKEHGIFWALNQMVENKIIPKTLAVTKIKSLVNSSPIYRNNKELL